MRYISLKSDRMYRRGTLSIAKNAWYIIDLRDVENDISILMNILEGENSEKIDIPVYWPAQVIRTPSAEYLTGYRRLILCGLKQEVTLKFEKIGRPLELFETDSVSLINTLTEFIPPEQIIEFISAIVSRDYKLLERQSEF